eukprot:1222092-Rhodomonas_salina.4
MRAPTGAWFSSAGIQRPTRDAAFRRIPTSSPPRSPHYRSRHHRHHHHHPPPPRHQRRPSSLSTSFYRLLPRRHRLISPRHFRLRLRLSPSDTAHSAPPAAPSTASTIRALPPSIACISSVLPSAVLWRSTTPRSLSGSPAHAATKVASCPHAASNITPCHGSKLPCTTSAIAASRRLRTNSNNAGVTFLSPLPAPPTPLTVAPFASNALTTSTLPARTASSSTCARLSPCTPALSTIAIASSVYPFRTATLAVPPPSPSSQLRAPSCSILSSKRSTTTLRSDLHPFNAGCSDTSIKCSAVLAAPSFSTVASPQSGKLSSNHSTTSRFPCAAASPSGDAFFSPPSHLHALNPLCASTAPSNSSLPARLTAPLAPAPLACCASGVLPSMLASTSAARASPRCEASTSNAAIALSAAVSAIASTDTCR